MPLFQAIAEKLEVVALDQVKLNVDFPDIVTIGETSNLSLCHIKYTNKQNVSHSSRQQYAHADIFRGTLIVVVLFCFLQVGNLKYDNQNKG